MFLDARGALQRRSARRCWPSSSSGCKRSIDDAFAGRAEAKAEFSKVDDARQLTLVETSTMDESVVTRQHQARRREPVLRRACSSSTAASASCSASPTSRPTATRSRPATIVDAFADALKDAQDRARIKFQILKELNQASLSEINAIYARPQQAPAGLNDRAGAAAAPGQHRPPSGRARATRKRRRAASRRRRRSPEVDVMAMFQRMFGERRTPQARRRPQHAAVRRVARCAAGADACPSYDAPAAISISRRSACRAAGRRRRRTFAPLRADAVGLRARRADHLHADLHEGLTRLQAGQSGFRRRRRRRRRSRASRQGLHNVLRDLQESPLGAEGEPARIDDHRDGRDAVRLHLRDQGPARRHQGAARAAADPGAQGRDARRRVLREEVASGAPARERARAGGPRLVAGDGAGRSALQARSTRSSTRSSTASPTTSAIFDELRDRAPGVPRRGREGRRSEHPVDAPRRSTRRDRREIAAVVAQARRSSGGSRRSRSRRSSRRSCASTGSARSSTSTCRDGEESEAWDVRRSPRSRTSCGACSRSGRPKTASISSRCCRRF